MNKMILTIGLIAAVSAQLTFSTKNQCSCEQLSTQADCAVQYPICTWSNSACSTAACSSLTSQANCAANLKCMWSNSSCTTFTFCNQISGTTQADCFAKSRNCLGSDGTNCASSQSLKACTDLPTQTTPCVGYVSSSGVCYFNSKGACAVAENCTQLNANSCTNLGGACVWNSTSTSCVQGTCGQFTNNDTCTNFVTALNSQTFSLCQWNSTSSLCVSAPSASSLTSSNCYTNTRYTYRWMSDSNTCVACYGIIIQIAILILAIMI